MRHPSAPMAGDRAALRREVLSLVVLVLVLHGGFIALYPLAGVASGSANFRLGYGGVWIAATLAVVLRGLWRVRLLRLRLRRERVLAVAGGGD